MSEPPSFRTDTAVEWSRCALRRLVWLMVAANVAVPVGLFLYAGAIGESYWWEFWGEGNLMTWFSSVQLLLVAGAAYAQFELGRALARRGDAEGAGRRWVWLVFAVGFVFLSLDERFQIHETIRDQLLRPHHMFSHIPLVSPGDVVLYSYLIVGIVLTGFLLGELRRRKLAVVAFAVGVALIASTTFVDALPEDMEAKIGYFWTSAYEETGEIWTQLLFLISFWLVLDRRLVLLRGATAEAPGPRPPGAERDS